MVTIFSVFTVCGIWQIVRGKKRKKLVVLFKDYAARLAADPLRSINKLAAACGIAAETVKKNILKMIHKGFFVNAYIDFNRNCLVFAQESSNEKSGLTQQGESTEYIRVSCPGCGAKNKIQKGTVGECEFCGSYLSQG
jgi:ribosomal protein S27E